MKQILVVVVSIIVGFGLGFVVDRHFSQSGAPWSQQREMQGCWMAGSARLLVRQGDTKLQFLEAQMGLTEMWVRLNTSIEEDQILATPRNMPGLVRLSPDADRLVTTGFDTVSNTEWVRCEATQIDR